MMMVDTINPNTGQPDDSVAASQEPASAPASVPAEPVKQDRFYGGFDSPDEVKINLAEGGLPASNQATSPQVEPQAAPAAPSAPAMSTQPNGPQFTDTVTSAPAMGKNEAQVHASYASREPLNVRGLLVIGAIFLTLTVVGGVSAYFIAGSAGAGSEKKLQDQLTAIQKQLSDLQQQPTALQAPTQTTTPTVTTQTPSTTTTPDTTTSPDTTTTPTTTPTIEAPSTTVSPATDDGRQGTG